MSCAAYFQPFIDHLSQTATADHAPILTFLAAGNRAEANRFVVYMEGVLGLSHSLKAAPPTRTAPVMAQAQQLVGVCNAYYSDRGEAEGATTVPSVAGVTSSGEIVIPPDAIAENTVITVPADAVADPPSPHTQTFQLSRVQRFDVHRFDTFNVALSLPNGPMTFLAGGKMVARFSTLECRDNGLLVCTSDLDRSILVLSFQAAFRSLEP
jgi:hypothetical protein